MRRGRQIYRKAAKVAKERRGRGARAEALRRGGVIGYLLEVIEVRRKVAGLKVEGRRSMDKRRKRSYDPRSTIDNLRSFWSLVIVEEYEKVSSNLASSVFLETERLNLETFFRF